MKEPYGTLPGFERPPVLGVSVGVEPPAEVVGVVDPPLQVP